MPFHVRLRFKIFLGFLTVIVISLLLQFLGLLYVFNIPLDLGRMLLLISGNFILLTTIALFLSRLFTGTIQKLKQELHDHEEGKKIETALSISANDEVGEIARLCSNLLKKAHDLEEQLKQENRSLVQMQDSLHHKDSDVNNILSNFAQKEAVLAAEKNKFEVVLSGISDAIIGLDMNHMIVTFNTEAEVLTGYKSEQVVGKAIYNVLKLVQKEEELAAEEYCPIKSTNVTEGIVCSKQDVKLLGLNKESFVNITAARIKEGEKLNLGCILSIHDITAQRELEEMRLNFVSMAAHELRTPLTSLKGYLNILIEETTTVLSEDQKTILKRMQIALKQLMSLIENLLSVTRMERGAFVIAPKPLEWLVLVKETVEELVNTAQEKKITLTVIEPTAPPPIVMADQVRTTEVLTNLVANAIHYTGTGGSITVSLEVTANEVITHVQDTGEGIPKEAIPRLFQKFFRVAGKLEHGSRGTGLGLYISKTIIDMHKGRIWVDSVLGQGSTFSFSLPIAQAANPSLTAQV